MQIGLELLELADSPAAFPNALKLALAKRCQTPSFVLAIAPANTAPDNIARIKNPVLLAGLNGWVVHVLQD